MKKKDKDLEIFMDFCDLYQNYFKRAEIEGMDMVIGHLACIGRDYVNSELLQVRKDLVNLKDLIATYHCGEHKIILMAIDLMLSSPSIKTKLK